MRLLTKFNLVLISVFTLGLALAGFVSYRLLHQGARRQVIQHASLMMETALSTRKYTLNQVKPLLQDKLKHRFLPQTVPAFAATENFRYLRATYPEYSYKEATLNPTNPSDLAVAWEANIVKQFRRNGKLKEVVGERDTPKGKSLFLSRPIKITDRNCLVCHDTPARAPHSMLAIYGAKRGFGWKHNEVIGAQVISVPMSLPVQMANAAFVALLGSLVGVFAVTLLALNVMLRLIVIRPVTQLSHIADEISKGNMEVEDLPVKGKDEIAVLAGSFNRMQRSLKQAMKMLED